ncbi:hypothetical protein ACFE04_025222 [Oxalis oulophora]
MASAKVKAGVRSIMIEAKAGEYMKEAGRRSKRARAFEYSINIKLLMPLFIAALLRIEDPTSMSSVNTSNAIIKIIVKGKDASFFLSVSKDLGNSLIDLS